MNKREQYKRLYRFFSSVLIIGMLTAIFAYVWYSLFADNEDILVKTFFRWGNYVLISLYAVILFLFYRIYGAHKVGYMRVSEAAYTQVLSVLCTNVFTYFQLSLIGRWEFLSHSIPIMWMTAFQVVLVLVWSFVARFGYTKLYPPRELLVVYGKYSPNSLINKLAARQDKYTIGRTISIKQDMDEIKARILESGGVLLMDIPAEIRNQLLKFCFRQNIRCYTTPKISDIMLRSAEEIHLFDTSLLLSRNTGLSAEQQFCKRAFDVVFSLIFLLVFSPFMLLISLAIKLCDGGPVFFTQDRLTQDGKIFKLYKFRSMYVNNQASEYCMTRENDKRVTPVGKIIRNIHFDELPQIINILKGDMSFVGPRPECPHLAAEYQQIVPEFDFRLKMKAGLTGFAQVYGKYNTTPLDKLKLDLVYIENYSFRLDLKLILLTFKILFQKENTEGIKDWQTSAATEENLEKIGKEQ